MNAAEAMQALLDGKKIRQQEWSIDRYIYLKNGVLVDEDDEEVFYFICFNSSLELYKDTKEDTKLYQWASRTEPDTCWSSGIIATENQAAEYYAESNIEYKKLDDLLKEQG